METAPAADESAYTLSTPGRLVDVLQQAMLARLSPRRSGWSTATHLGTDLERHFGVRAPIPAVERALRVLLRRKVVRVTADDAGVIWYRIREPYGS